MNEHCKKVLTIGVIDLSFHRIMGSIHTHMLRHMGFEVNRIFTPHKDAFDKLKSGEVDMITSAWLPFSDGQFKSEVEKEVPLLELGNHYQPQAFWGVPNYISSNEVAEIDDLKKPHVIRKMKPAIQGICPGAGISQSSVKMMDSYGLHSNGYRFYTGTEECCYGAFEQAVEQQQWVVVPLWKPNFLRLKYPIRELRDPKKIISSNDTAVLLLREDKRDLFTTDQIEQLDRLSFSVDIIEKLDERVSRYNDPLDELCEEFLQAEGILGNRN